MKITQHTSFKKEFKKYQKKYRTLESDLTILEKIIKKFPHGDDSRHCNTLKKHLEKCICKRRMMCRSLKSSEFRIIYYYDGSSIKLIYLEIYYKGDKTTEDNQRINTFWESKIEN